MFPKGKGKYDNTIKLRKGTEQVNEKIIRCLDTFWAFKKVLSLLVPKLRVPTQKRIGGKAVKRYSSGGGISGFALLSIAAVVLLLPSEEP